MLKVWGEGLDVRAVFFGTVNDQLLNGKERWVGKGNYARAQHRAQKSLLFWGNACSQHRAEDVFNLVNGSLHIAFGYVEQIEGERGMSWIKDDEAVTKIERADFLGQVPLRVH